MKRRRENPDLTTALLRKSASAHKVPPRWRRSPLPCRKLSPRVRGSGSCQNKRTNKAEIRLQPCCTARLRPSPLPLAPPPAAGPAPAAGLRPLRRSPTTWSSDLLNPNPNLPPPRGWGKLRPHFLLVGDLLGGCPGTDRGLAWEQQVPGQLLPQTGGGDR